MDSIVEEAIRKELKNPEGKLTKKYLGQVTRLVLNGTKKVTDAGLMGVAKLKQLKGLYLRPTHSQVLKTVTPPLRKMPATHGRFANRKT